MQQFLRAQWSKRGLWAWLFSPLSLLVCMVAALKRWAYRIGLLKSQAVKVPLIVIGNLGVGGTGKTPLVAHIASLLNDRGYRPGIICRGYKGKAQSWPQAVTPLSDPELLGDESVMLAALTQCPVVAGPDRVASAQHLLNEYDCDVILSDDGFQHLRLARDIDVLVFDARHGNGLGNGWCLPSGPLREAPSARHRAQMQVFHGAHAGQQPAGAYSMTLEPGSIYALTSGRVANLDRLRGKTLHAMAGIGHPARFFDSLRALGLTIIEHAYDDHHDYSVADLEFKAQHEIITTQKDAIKLARFEPRCTIWVLPVRARVQNTFDTELINKLNQL